MADILGPSGQPLQPNPFLSQQQSMSSNVSVNTQPAQQAFADLQKVMDNIMKGFGGNWDKVSKDSLAAQERFYRVIGDKAKERQVMLQRYSKEAISAIDEETKIKLSNLDEELRAGKKTQEELERERTKISKDALNNRISIEKEANKQIARDKGVGGLIRGGATALSGAVGGGPIGGLISGIGSLIADPMTAIPAAIIGSMIEMLNTKAVFTKTGAQLAGAGFGLGSGAGVGLDFTTRLFGGATSPFSQALSQSQQRDIVGMMSGSRSMIDQTRSANGMTALQGNLGLFANILPNAAEEMAIFTDATKSLGMSQKDISNTFISSRVNSERTKITQLDAIQTQMEMQKALRNITNDGTVAASVLFNVGGFLKGIGTSEAERNRMTLGIAQAGANLSLPQIAGMFAFTHGGKMPTQADIFGTNGMLGNNGTGTFGLMGSFLSKIGKQTKDPMQKLFAADQLNRQFNLGLRTQDMPQFFNLTDKLASGNISNRDFEKQVTNLSKQAKAMTVEGMSTLLNVVDPITRMENFFTNFWRMVDDRLAKYLGRGTHATPTSQSIPQQKNIDKNSRYDVYSSH